MRWEWDALHSPALCQGRPGHLWVFWLVIIIVRIVLLQGLVTELTTSTSLYNIRTHKIWHILRYFFNVIAHHVLFKFLVSILSLLEASDVQLNSAFCRHFINFASAGWSLCCSCERIYGCTWNSYHSFISNIIMSLCSFWEHCSISGSVELVRSCFTYYFNMAALVLVKQHDQSIIALVYKHLLHTGTVWINYLQIAYQLLSLK